MEVIIIYEVTFFASVWLHDNFILHQNRIFRISDATMQATLNTDCGNCLRKIRIGQTECLKEKCHNSIVAVGISCDMHVHECNYNSLSILLLPACRPMPSDGGPLGFVLGVSKKETWIKQELLTINRLLFNRGLAIVGQGIKWKHQRAVVNGSTFSCTSMDRSKLTKSSLEK